eukprot:COSAG01_NODE_72663_length_252_cov_0.921569_1_plen_32_part_01
MSHLHCCEVMRAWFLTWGLLHTNVDVGGHHGS